MKSTTTDQAAGGGYRVTYHWKGELNYITNACFSTLEEAQADIADFYNDEGDWEEEEE